MFFFVVAGACGLLVQACANVGGVEVVWEQLVPVRILPAAKTDKERLTAFEGQLNTEANKKYDTTFQGTISEARSCYKIDANTSAQKVQCSELPQPNAIHVAQHVYFPDEASKNAFLKNLGLQ
jgi:hypothetical protein